MKFKGVCIETLFLERILASCPVVCTCSFFCSVQTFIYSSLAQSVEHAAVNRRVVGSSPTGGAKNSLAQMGGRIFYVTKSNFYKSAGVDVHVVDPRRSFLQ